MHIYLKLKPLLSYANMHSSPAAQSLHVAFNCKEWGEGAYCIFCLKAYNTLSPLLLSITPTLSKLKIVCGVDVLIGSATSGDPNVSTA